MLIQKLKDFNGDDFKSLPDLTNAFHEIANIAINGGYFIVGEDKLRLTDIEFYYYDEKGNAPCWKKDYSKYRRGKDYPYISNVGTIVPHQSGVDISFEKESNNYRASFLIRGFSYWDHNDGSVKTEKNPQYLWDYLFAEYCSIEHGFPISWHNGLDEFETIDLEPKKRVRIFKYDETGKKTKEEDTDRLWRFCKKNEKK